jgi:hypothetical protein
LQEFAGRPHLIAIDAKPLPPPKPRSRFDGKEAKDIFRVLHGESVRLKVLTETELFLLQTGLMYLVVAAERARSQRDPKDMELVWRRIHPIMKRVGLLDLFNGEAEAVRRVRNCIKDKAF